MRSAIRGTTRTSSPRGSRSTGSSSSGRTRPIASRACRRCGTRRSPVTPSSRSAATAAERQARRGLDWLATRQVLDIAGDWAVQRPDVRPGGWAFQYANPHYPDLDDTAVVVMAMDRAPGRLPPADAAAFAEPIARGARVDRRAAEPERRLGRVRCRQHADISEPHPVRRSRRAARSADRRRHRALHVDAGAARRDARNEPGFGARRRTTCSTTRKRTAAGSAAGA